MRIKIQLLFINLILFLIFFSFLYGQGTGKINVAVMDLEALGVTTDAQRALSDRLRTELFNTGRFAVMERNRMDEILKEQGFQQTGCTNNECIVEAGRLLGVDRMIAGSIGKVGTIYTVSLRMIDIETGRIMLAKTEDCNCPVETVLTTSLRNVALKMAGLSPESETEPILSKEKVIGQGDFYFKSTPSGAQVFIDDEPLSGVTPLMKEGIPSGTHQIRMQKGYYCSIQTVFLEPDEFKKVEMQLVKTKGSLKIVTTPFEADIFLDNKSMGVSPQTLTSLDAGEHLLKLSKHGYLDQEQIVLVEGDKINRLDITLEKIKPATLKITSQPPNCDVYINSQYKGKTPIVVRELMPGLLNFKLVNPIYQDLQESVVLKNGETKEISPELIKKRGTLIIESTPTNAKVEVDGIMKGQTPLTLNDVEYGVHKIQVSRIDYQMKEEKLELYSSGPEKVFISLQLATGVLSIAGNPTGAEVFIDKKMVGSLPLENYQLDKGNYNIQIKAKGYEDYSQTIEISPNKEKSLPVNLILKSNTKAFSKSLFIPGLGQAYLGKKGKATLFPVLEVAAIVGIFAYNNKYNNAISDYNDAKDGYHNAFSQVDIDDYYNEMTIKYDEIESAEKIRNIFLGAAIGIWIWNVMDAAILGPDIEKSNKIGIKQSDKKFIFCTNNANGEIGVSICFSL